MMERCAECGKVLDWIAVAFGRVNDPACGRCLLRRAVVKVVERAMRHGWQVCWQSDREAYLWHRATQWGVRVYVDGLVRVERI